MPKTVMIVEDNELNMKLFNDLLESRGYSIIQTRNGMEALGLARAHHPDLILMDIQERILQGGCEGYISKPISVPHFLETIARYIGPAN